MSLQMDLVNRLLCCLFVGWGGGGGRGGRGGGWDSGGSGGQ